MPHGELALHNEEGVCGQVEQASQNRVLRHEYFPNVKTGREPMNHGTFPRRHLQYLHIALIQEVIGIAKSLNTQSINLIV